MSFCGRRLPRYYVAAWYAISVPLACIAAFLLGAFVLARTSSSPAGIKAGSSDAALCFVAVLFFIPVVATFAHPGLLYVAVSGLKWVVERTARPIEWRDLYSTFPLFVIAVPQVALAAITLSLASQLPWIARNHPYGHAYLNVAGRPFGAQFDRDYWGLSQKQLLEWLAGHAEVEPIRIAYVAGQAGSVLILPEKLQHRFAVVDPSSADFIVTSFQRSTENHLPVAGFEEIHAIRLDGYKLGAVYKAGSPVAPAAATENR